MVCVPHGATARVDQQLDTPRLHSVGLLWTRDRPVAEPLSDNKQHSKKETSMPAPGFETAIPAIDGTRTDILNRAATRIGSMKTGLLKVKQ
jgi:hypothetical protein